MPTRLEPITAAEYPAWFDKQAVSYAADKVRANQWAEEGAVERARQETERYLTDGVDTPNHSLNHIVDSTSGARVGTLWWCLSERLGRRIAFIFDIAVEERFRRRGYATSALEGLEARARTENIEALSLHVFAFNQSAVKLYEKLGYAPTSISMSRELGTDSA